MDGDARRLRFDFLHDRGCLLRRGAVGESDCGSICREALCNGRADRARTARDESGLAGQFQRGVVIAFTSLLGFDGANIAFLFLYD